MIFLGPAATVAAATGGAAEGRTYCHGVQASSTGCSSLCTAVTQEMPATV